MMPRLRYVTFMAALVAGAAALVPGVARAQSASTAAVAGEVVDSAGVAVVGARVELRAAGTGVAAVARTGTEGRFYLGNLRPGGPYTLTVSYGAAAPLVREGIRLRTDETLRLELRWSAEPFALEEIDVVVRADPALSPSRTGAATFVDTRTIEALPSLTRDVTELAALSPMVRIEEDALSIAGQNDRYNSLRIDGAIAQDLFGASTTGVPGGEANAKALPLSAVEQYQVLVAPYDVRYSGFTGGVLNAVTRSGTNTWRASAFGTFRDDRLLGDIVLDGISQAADDYRRSLMGFSLGGPIVRDRVHLFTAVELEERRTPALGVHAGLVDPLRLRIQPDSLRRVSEILRTAYGLEPGEYGRITLHNPIHNVFGRLDVQLGGGHRLVLRHNYAGAEEDREPSHEPVDEYEFASTGVRRETDSHAFALQWFAGRGAWTNELLLNVQRLRARARPASDFPLIDVVVDSDFGDGFTTRRVRAGAEYFSQADELDQDVVQWIDEAALRRGDHRFTFGAAAERAAIRHLFVPGAEGRFVFDTLPALEAGLPSLYERTLLRPGVEDPAVRFAVYQFSAYAQDEWTPSDRLTLRYGVRFDVPVLPDRPRENPDFEETFGVSTADIPRAHVLISQRFGFNWRPDEATQIRGGAGLFAGRPPLAWIANAYANTGLRTVLLHCEGALAPAPTAEPPDTCLDGSGPAQDAPQTINFIDPDFRYPQDARLSIAIDRRLPLGIVATVEGVFTRAIRQIEIEELNLALPVVEPRDEAGYTDGFGDRKHFGTPTNEGFVPRRRDPRFAQVIRIGNGKGNFSHAVAVELRRTLAERLTLRAGYAYARSGDTRSLVSADMTANFGLTPTGRDPNRPALRPSFFDQPHKVSASATLRLPERWGSAETSLFYVGQSGRPYSYVYLGDANGDGYPGQGSAFDANNDLIHVPVRVGEMPASLATFAMFGRAIGLDACLEEFKGAIIARNTCRTPWTHRLDFRLRQPVSWAGRTLDVTLDIANALNLLNDEWGHIYRTPPVVPILAIEGRRPEGLRLDPTDPLYVSYSGATARSPSTGHATAVLSHTPVIPASQWQLQLGLSLRL